jgi:hypothetical protein
MEWDEVQADGGRLSVVGEQPNIELLTQDLIGLGDFGRSFQFHKTVLESNDDEFGNADLVQLTIDFVLALASSATYDAVLHAIQVAKRRGSIHVENRDKPPGKKA